MQQLPYHKLPKASVIEKLYFQERLSTGAIADRYGASRTAVWRKLTRHGFVLRSLSDAKAIAANHVSLTRKLLEFINGLLLGDGCLVSNGRSAAYKHYDKHQAYIRWLIKQLLCFGIETRAGCQKREGKGDFGQAYYLETLNYRELHLLRIKWYPHGKKKIPSDISLAPSTLRNWYVGDGSFRSGRNGTRHGERVHICKHVALDNEGTILVAARLRAIGIEVTIHADGLYIRSCSRKRFFSYILRGHPNVPSCYVYKFPHGYRGAF